MSINRIGKIRVVEVPVGEPPREAWYGRKTLAKEIMRTVGGPFDEITPFDNGIAVCEHDSAQKIHPANRAIYMTESMVEADYVSQMDYETVPPVGGLFAITYGPLVLVAVDMEKGEPTSMTKEQVDWALRTFADETSGERELEAYAVGRIEAGAYRTIEEA